GGGRLPPGAAARQAGQLRLEPLRGLFRVREEAPFVEGRPAGAARARVLARARLLDQRRLRLSRHGGADSARSVLLRRLLRGHDLELPGGDAWARLEAGGVRPCALAVVLRRGRAQRALRHLPRRRPLRASVAPRPSGAGGLARPGASCPRCRYASGRAAAAYLRRLLAEGGVRERLQRL